VRRNSGGNPSGKPKRMVPDPAYQGVNIMGKMSDKDMAYALAKNRETGKLTDKDMANARKSLNKMSDKDMAFALAKTRETGKLTDKDIKNAQVVIEELNPGKSIDVTEMAMGGYMDDMMVKKMMGGGYMKYKDKM